MSLMNTDVKILNKMLVLEIQQYRNILIFMTSLNWDMLYVKSVHNGFEDSVQKKNIKYLINNIYLLHPEIVLFGYIGLNKPYY